MGFAFFLEELRRGNKDSGASGSFTFPPLLFGHELHIDTPDPLSVGSLIWGQHFHRLQVNLTRMARLVLQTLSSLSQKCMLAKPLLLKD